MLDIEDIGRLGACTDAMLFLEKCNDVATAWKECTRADWMLWLLHRFPNIGLESQIKDVGKIVIKLTLEYIKKSDELVKEYKSKNIPLDYKDIQGDSVAWRVSDRALECYTEEMEERVKSYRNCRKLESKTSRLYYLVLRQVYFIERGLSEEYSIKLAKEIRNIIPEYIYV